MLYRIASIETVEEATWEDTAGRRRREDVKLQRVAGMTAAVSGGSGSSNKAGEGLSIHGL